MNCTFKYRAHSWPEILEVKDWKLYQLIHERELFACALLNKYLLGHCLEGLPRFMERQNRQIDVGFPLIKINMMQRKFFKNLKFWFWRGLYSCGCFPSIIYSSKIKVNSLSAISAWQRALQNRLIISSSWTCQKYVGSFACN